MKHLDWKRIRELAWYFPGILFVLLYALFFKSGREVIKKAYYHNGEEEK